MKAEAFDAARYLLTPAIQTKWGMLADARTLSDIVTELLSHPLAEFRLVGERMRDEARRELPTLLAHAKPSVSCARNTRRCPRSPECWAPVTRRVRANHRPS